jgi:protein-L-isoaspartate(D-aspartate) O-methyltransferase
MDAGSAGPAELRRRMVRQQIAARGVTDRAVLAAMEEVPREAFVSAQHAKLAHEDQPLPIEAGQTISQPYIVALMAEALQLGPGARQRARVLEIGTGSGYAAAVLSRIAAEVYSVERIESLASTARERLAELGYDNVHVLHGDGTLGWPEHAPYDGIVVAAGGPEVPEALLSQLRAGGRLVIPVGATQSEQSLLRVTRTESGGIRREDLGGVRFVPLIGAQGFEPEAGAPRPAPPARAKRGVASLVAEGCEPFGSIESADLAPLLSRIGSARVVAIGEATHGTSEFYRMRARITRELIERKGFDVVAVEADWPDAASLDRHVRRLSDGTGERPFRRFPTWMWRNEEVGEFVAWLRAWNDGVKDPARRVAFSGLDLYSLHASMNAVVHYLEGVDPEAAALARRRYGCLAPWEDDPHAYGQAAASGRYGSCEDAVVAMLAELLRRRLDLSAKDGERFFDAAQNARLVANAEEYYRASFQGRISSWNLRDEHMFETLQALLAHRGAGSKAVVWAHNSHVGDANATEMAARGELNIGRLCRKALGDAAYLVGFGTDHGTVMAAHDWGDPPEIMQVRPSHERSYERLGHDSGVAAFLLPLRVPARPEVREELLAARLERAIGVIYRPRTEMQSHYFQAVLPRQFDEWIWFDETSAVTPRGPAAAGDPSEPHPFD